MASVTVTSALYQPVSVAGKAKEKVPSEAGVGAGQTVAGEALDLAADHDLVPFQIELVVFVKGEGEGREDELVHAEGIALEVLLAGFHLQLEIAVALALGQGEGTGHGTELVRLQFQAVDFLVLAVQEDHFHGLARDDGDAVHEVALVHHGLELQDIAGVIGPTVLIDMAEGAVRAVVAVTLEIVSVRAHLPAGPEIRPGTGLGRQVIVRFLVTVNGILELLGEHREAVQPDLLRDHGLVPLPEDEFRLVEGLS